MAVLEALLLLPAYFMLLHLSAASATVIIYQGNVSNSGAAIGPIEGIATLNSADVTTSHFFDCTATQGCVGGSVWSKSGGTQRFPTTLENPIINGVMINTCRMNLAPIMGNRFGPDDVGLFICTDSTSSKSASIYIAAGTEAIIPVDESREVILGEMTQLGVHATAIPPLESGEIVWSRSDGSPVDVSNGSRFSLSNNMQLLTIDSVRIEDSDLYQIEIVRDGVSTSINLNVHVGVAVLSNPGSAMPLEHATVAFTCAFTGNPAPSAIVWEREGGDQLPVTTRTNIVSETVMNDSVTLFTRSSVFTINNVLYEDQGRYRCRAINTLTGNIERNATSAFAELEVTPRLQLTSNSDVLNGDNLASVSEDSRVEIACSGFGTSTLNWMSSTGVDIPMVNDDLSPDSSNIFQRYDITTRRQFLIIQRFTPTDDIAIYTCETDLTVDRVSLSVYITSSDPAVFIDEETIYTAAGSSAQISATVYSSTQNGLVVEWRHEDSPISTTNDPHYSQTTMGTSVYILTITNVTVDVLGSYTAVVTVGEDTQSDSVRLSFPVSPAATIIPELNTTLENETVTFQCMAGGTETTVEWGPQPLPSGVVQSGSDLVIAQATRDHAGQYVCTVSNSAGSVTSTATLTVNYAPTTIISREGTTQSSSNGILQVTAEQGDLAPTFSCSADGSPPPTISWGGKDGSVTLPDGVSQTTNSQNQALVWSRPLEYGDSGQYLCSAMNTVGSSAATLDLLVRNPPTIITIAPTSPVSSTTATNFMVPQGYSGNVVTCTALGWPTPTIEWHREGGNLTASVMSVWTRDEGSAYVTAQLRWLDEFQESDAGRYICEVRASDTDLVSSETISLEMTSVAPPTPTPATCTLDSQTVYFQVQVLDTNCEMLGMEEIANNFGDNLVSIVNTMCQDCDVTDNDLEVMGVATCSDQVARGAVFRGVIDTSDKERTQEIFCTLSMWQQTGPLVLVNNDLHLVDRTLSLAHEEELTTSTHIPTETETPSPVPLVSIYVGVAVGGVVILMIAILCVVLCCLVVVKRKVSRRPSPYERTYHVNSQNSFDKRASLSNAFDVEPGTYSTLNREEKYPHVQQTRSSFPDVEMGPISRMDSRAFLLGTERDSDSRRSSSQLSPLGQKPEPYEKAISSQENLCQEFGSTPDGIGTGLGNRRMSASRNNRNNNRGSFDSDGGTPDGIRRNARGSSCGRNPESTPLEAFSNGGGSSLGIANIDAIGNAYEQIDLAKVRGAHRRAGTLPPEMSPLEVEVRGANRRAGTLPPVVSSPGVVMRGSPPAGFRRHVSATDSEDYSRLNLGGNTPPPTPPNNRGGRMASTSSSTISGQSHQLARQHYSITMHNGLPSPNSRRGSSHSFVVRESSPLSPTSPASKAPPPYSEVAGPPPLPPPYSPSASSMVENGAYESIDVLAAEQEEVINDKELDKEQQQQWHSNNRNGDDFSTNQQLPRHALESRQGRPDIMPYNQVSNSEIASRMTKEEEEEEEEEARNVPRFSITKSKRNNTPFPYSEAVSSSTESLSHLPHQTIQTVPVESCQ